MIAGISGALCVSLGAFGAHGLEDFLEAHGRTGTYETAVKYHFYHSLLLVLLGIMKKQYATVPLLNSAAICCIAGMVIFSGSLYVLCLTNVSWLGAITPVGGLFLMAAWLMIGIGAWKATK